MCTVYIINKKNDAIHTAGRVQVDCILHIHTDGRVYICITVIFFTRIWLTPIERLYRNNKRNFCRGALAGFVGGPVFSVF